LVEDFEGSVMVDALRFVGLVGWFGWLVWLVGLVGWLVAGFAPCFLSAIEMCDVNEAH
jgi:hypothetical protein